MLGVQSGKLLYVFQEEIERILGEEWAKSEAKINHLLSEKHELADELRRTRHSLRVQSDGWRKERSKATALMFSMCDNHGYIMCSDLTRDTIATHTYKIHM